MSAEIATQSAVYDAADAMLAQGVEPSITLVRDRIGGGSYSTIREKLAQWKADKLAEALNPPPETILAQGTRLAGEVWKIAKQEADVAVQEARTAAQAALRASESELAQAQDHIRALERDQEHVTAEIQACEERCTRERSRSQAQEVRIEQLQSQLIAQTQALENARMLEQEQRVRAAALEGERAALKQQLADVLVAMSRSQQVDREAGEGVAVRGAAKN
jgi:molecular chaperone GrpE (heat shock protein)